MSAQAHFMCLCDATCDLCVYFGGTAMRFEGSLLQCEHVIRDAQSNTCTLASTDTEAIMLETLSC